jgi:hypothetical protein
LTSNIYEMLLSCSLSQSLQSFTTCWDHFPLLFNLFFHLILCNICACLHTEATERDPMDRRGGSTQGFILSAYCYYCHLSFLLFVKELRVLVHSKGVTASICVNRMARQLEGKVWLLGGYLDEWIHGSSCHGLSINAVNSVETLFFKLFYTERIVLTTGWLLFVFSLCWYNVFFHT